MKEAHPTLKTKFSVTFYMTHIERRYSFPYLRGIGARVGLHLFVADKHLVSGLQRPRSPGDLPLPHASSSPTVHVQGWSRGTVPGVHSVILHHSVVRGLERVGDGVRRSPGHCLCLN